MAVTEVFESGASLQVEVPLQAPAQPVKVELPVGCAVKVISVPGENVAWQVDPQSMPAGELLTVPVPSPETFTLT